MIEIKNDFIKKYQYTHYKTKEQYVVYIKETNESYEYYLQNEKYGIIELMFALYKEQNTLEELLEIVTDNIDIDIEYYKRENEDKD